MERKQKINSYILVISIILLILLFGYLFEFDYSSIYGTITNKKEEGFFNFNPNELTNFDNEFIKKIMDILNVSNANNNNSNKIQLDKRILMTDNTFIITQIINPYLYDIDNDNKIYNNLSYNNNDGYTTKLDILTNYLYTLYSYIARIVVYCYTTFIESNGDGINIDDTESLIDKIVNDYSNMELDNEPLLKFIYMFTNNTSDTSEQKKKIHNHIKSILEDKLSQTEINNAISNTNNLININSSKIKEVIEDIFKDNIINNTPLFNDIKSNANHITTTTSSDGTTTTGMGTTTTGMGTTTTGMGTTTTGMGTTTTGMGTTTTGMGTTTSSDGTTTSSDGTTTSSNGTTTTSSDGTTTTTMIDETEDLENRQVLLNKLSELYSNNGDLTDEIKESLRTMPIHVLNNVCRDYCSVSEQNNGKFCRDAGCIIGWGSKYDYDNILGYEDSSTRLGYSSVDDDYSLLRMSSSLTSDHLSTGEYRSMFDEGNLQNIALPPSRRSGGTGAKLSNTTILQKDTDGVSNIFAPNIYIFPKKNGDSSGYSSYISSDTNNPSYKDFINNLISNYG